jgi:chromosome segregation ATPase
MKKVIFLLVTAVAFFTSCIDGPKKADLIAQNDSLKSIIASRDAALDEMISTINVVEEGFKAINEAQGRINLDAAGAEQTKKASLQRDIDFINQTLQKNKQQIAELEEKLKKSQSYSKQLNKMVQKLKAELEEKNKQIISLQQELAQKNIHIEELDKSVQQLNANVDELSATKVANEKTISAQESSLNTVWYAIGTKRELKEQNLLDGRKVLREADANMSYFTKADKRKLSTVETHAKSAKLLTTHPEGSYKSERNSEKQYVLTITNADNFWSVSKYLIIQVK